MPPEFPPGALCSEEGCDQPMAGLRPSQQDLILEDDQGDVVSTLPAGSFDEGVCTDHMREDSDA